MPTLSWLTREKDVKCADAVAYRLAKHTQDASPAEGGVEFVVPHLMAWVQSELIFADSDVLGEYFERRWWIVRRS